MKTKPYIGISGGLMLETEGAFKGHWRAYVNDAYVQSIQDAGGTPVILPVTDSWESVISQLMLLDGLVLSGGADVSPQCYGEEPEPLLEDLLHRRDAFETTLLQVAQDLQLPVMGICRGLQMINVHYGGTLYQDLSLMEEKPLKHSQGNAPEKGTHSIRIAAESFLGQVFGETAKVNSFHHQGIRALAPGFDPVAWSLDGLIEGIESQWEPRVVGVQWHPEMMSQEDLQTQMLFQKFIDYSVSWKSSRDSVDQALKLSPVTDQVAKEVGDFFETVLKDLYKREGFGWEMAQTFLEELAYKKASVRASIEKPNELPHYYQLRYRGLLAGVFAVAKPGNLILDHVQLLDPDGNALSLASAEAQVPELASFFVHPKLQGCGIGKAMLGFAEGKIEELGFHQYCLDCGYSISQRFWKKQLGDGTFVLQDFWGPGASHMIWQKNIIK